MTTSRYSNPNLATSGLVRIGITRFPPDFHRIVYAESTAVARTAYAAFARKWAPRCPGLVRSLHEGGEELLTFFEFPKGQWKTLRTTT